MGSDAELIAHQPIEDLHDVLMRNERMVIPQTCFCCLFKPLGQEASLLSGMYPLLEQAVPTWLNRMFLPGSNKNHNSNGLGDTLHHTPRTRMVERVQGDQLSQGTKDTSAFLLTFLSS